MWSRSRSVALLVGAVVLNQVRPAYVDALLAFGVAALLYLVTEELLTKAHEEPEPRADGRVLPRVYVLFTLDMLV